MPSGCPFGAHTFVVHGRTHSGDTVILRRPQTACFVLSPDARSSLSRCASVCPSGEHDRCIRSAVPSYRFTTLASVIKAPTHDGERNFAPPSGSTFLHRHQMRALRYRGEFRRCTHSGEPDHLNKSGMMNAHLLRLPQAARSVHAPTSSTPSLAFCAVARCELPARAHGFP